MSGSLFVAHGDVTQISADALVYSTDLYGRPGHLYAAFCRHVPGFKAAYTQALQREGLKDRRRRLFAGETFWVPLPPDGQSRGRVLQGVVVVGVIGRDAALHRKIVMAAVNAAAQHLEPASDGKRLLVAMPGLRMGAALARRQDTEEAHRERVEAAKAQVEAAHEALTARDDLDVAFVAYTPDIYHLYERARRETGSQGPGGEMTVPPPLAQAIRDGECVLFIGSGLSSGAGLAGWQALVGKMAAEMGIAQTAQGSTDDFLDVAQLYRDQAGGQERLATLIREEFGGTRVKPTLAHYLLMGLGVRHVITTNYDTLLERALIALRRDPVKVVREEDVARTGETGAHFVVKFHGDAEAAESAVVLSRTDYDNFFRDRPAMASLLEGLLLNQTFLFVGYSLSDPNFKQVYNQVARILKASKRTAYAVQFDAGVSELTRDDWKRRQLELLHVPGEGAEQGRHFLRFLDALAAAVADEPKLFTGARTGLRGALSALGEEVSSAASRDNLSAEEVRVVASSLTFLTRHGWRPSVQHSAWETWQHLAGQCKDDPARKRMMLREALKHTESLKDAEAVRAELGSGTLS